MWDQASKTSIIHHLREAPGAPGPPPSLPGPAGCVEAASVSARPPGRACDGPGTWPDLAGVGASRAPDEGSVQGCRPQDPTPCGQRPAVSVAPLQGAWGAGGGLTGAKELPTF